MSSRLYRILLGYALAKSAVVGVKWALFGKSLPLTLAVVDRIIREAYEDLRVQLQAPTFRWYVDKDSVSSQ